MKKLFTFLPLVLFGCGTYTKQQELIHNNNQQKASESIQKARVISIEEGNTYYTKKIACLGDYYYQSNRSRFEKADGSINYHNLYRFSVAPIYDKTAKIYPSKSTAPSDLVINALSKIKGVSIVEIPLGYGSYESRNSFQSGGNSLSYEKYAGVFAQRPPVGVVFPSDYYVSGAIVQYDERNETGNKNLSTNLKFVTGKRNVSKITVGLQLRLVDAYTGKVQINPKTGLPNSIYLKNDLWKISSGVNFFRIISTNPWGVDYSVETSDPIQYSVNEIIERGVYDLFKTAISLPKEQEQECNNVE